jgi:DNA-nicking Smr family endonuclease
MSDKKKNEKSPFAGALADKLKNLDVDTSARSCQQDEQQQAQEATPPRASSHLDTSSADEPVEPVEPVEPLEPALSDEELFQQAFENVDREAIERAHRPAPRRKRARPSVDEDVDKGAHPRGAREETKQQARGADRRRASSEQPQKPLSERDLFEKAVQELEPGDVYSGKFHGQGPELPPEPEASDVDEEAPPVNEEAPPVNEEAPPVNEDEAREAVAKKREKLHFERAVGPVDEKNRRRQKYRKQSRPDPEEHVKQVTSFRSDSPDDMITPPLPKAGEGLNNVGPLTGAQKDMLARYKKRSRRREVPEINVRGDSVEDALRQIELFVHLQWKEKARFVRVIHGRGLQSDGDPVLKPAVLRWLEGPGYRYIKGYVPEVNSARDYGSVVAELERKD